MSDKPENPPAFPRAAQIEPLIYGQSGMTLRDWFAGQALMGFVANQSAMLEVIKAHNEDGVIARGWVAHTMYQFADAMLAARQS